MTHVQEITNGLRIIGFREPELIRGLEGDNVGYMECGVHGGGCTPHLMDGFSQVAKPQA